MKILTFTTLFPNSEQPNNAIFIQHRMAAVNKYCNAEVRVVAPVPWFPNLPVGCEHWRTFARISCQEVRGGMQVYHPRYLVTPKVGMSLYGWFMFLGVLSTVRRIYQKWPFDIIDAHYVYPDSFAAILLGKFFKCPVVVSARGTDINLYPRLRLIRPMIKQVVAKADGLISVCRSLADIMVELGAEPSKVRVIPNGIDPDLFYPMNLHEARSRLGLDTNRMILITVSGLREIKGLHLLVEALKILCNRKELDWITYIIGEGEEKENLQRQIENGGLKDQIHLLGEVSNNELVYWYNSADLFFLGSSREGWPNVVCEAIACGTPVVATNVNGIPDIVNSPDLGIIVERKVEAFVDALKCGMQTEWKHDTIAKHGQTRSWQTVAEEVYNLFCSIRARVT